MKWRTSKSGIIDHRRLPAIPLLGNSGTLARVMATLLFFVPAVAIQSATAQTSFSAAAGVQLQAGIEKENVDGDLKGAMSIYEKIAADATAPRDVRAKALLRLAGCEEKLGKQAKQLYEQIVRDYADQPAAAQARSRLAAIRQQEHPALPETMSVREIDREKLGYFGPFGPEDTDGHHATYIGADGNLYFGDISGQTKTLVYGSVDSEFRGVPGWEATRDLSIVALMLPKTKTRPVTLAVVKTDGTGYHELLHDDEEGNILGGTNEFQVRWSWDDRSLLVHYPGRCISTSGDPRPWLWVVSAGDGKRRELVHEKSGCIVRATFSPDGQFVAYEIWPVPPFPEETTSKLFVVPIKGDEPRLVYESDPWLDNTIPFQALADWTADGRYLAINGNHEGRHALFLLPMKAGAAIGSPVFVRDGDFEDAWSTSSGALIFADEDLSWPALHLASIDSDGKIWQWTPIELNRRPLPTYPSPSPDGSQIAYVTRNLNSTRTDLIVRDIATGRERIVYQSDADPVRCEYSAIRPIVFCTSGHGDEKTDLLSVSVDSGAVEQIATFFDARSLIHRPQDGKVFYFRRGKNKNGYTDPKLRWDRTTQEETLVADAAEVGDYLWTLSLDGGWVMRQRNGVLSFRPASGGDWKILASGIENYYMPGSTPDGNWAVYITSDPQGHREVFQVPFSGGEPRRVGDLPTKSLYPDLVFTPDGRKILAVGWGAPKYDLWALENFEPKTPK